MPKTGPLCYWSACRKTGRTLDEFWINADKRVPTSKFIRSLVGRSHGGLVISPASSEAIIVWGVT